MMSPTIGSGSLWKRINQRGGWFLLIALLFGVLAIEHIMANLRIGLSFALVDDRTIGEIHLIQFVQGHLWVIYIYFMFLLVVWFWLGLRSASRGITLLCLLLLSVPSLLYIRACVHIGTKLLYLPSSANPNGKAASEV